MRRVAGIPAFRIVHVPRERNREADRIVEEWNELMENSRKIYNQLPEEYHAAYYQLVHSPIELCANLNEMYVAAGKNKYYAERGAAAANYYADRVKELHIKAGVRSGRRVQL